MKKKKQCQEKKKRPRERKKALKEVIKQIMEGKRMKNNKNNFGSSM